MNGVEGMLYMFSQATSDGALTLTITFALGTDLDNAQVQVQNRVAQTLPRLPQDVQRIGVTTEKASPDFIMVVHLVSPDERYDMLYLSNYAHLQVKDETDAPAAASARCRSSAPANTACASGSIPNRLASRQLTTSDVVRAIREQNVQVAAGVLGAPPAPSDATFQLVDQHAGPADDGRGVRPTSSCAPPTTDRSRASRDVARLELGSSRYSLRSLLDNKPAVAIGVFQRPGTNALQASADVHATMERLKQNFPPGVDYRIVYDPTVFVRESINAVVAHAVRGDPARRHRRRRLPADVAGVDHSARRRAGLAGRHVRGHARPRLLAQHAVALRPRARHRHRRRRRDRRGRERRAAHRAGPAADGGDPAGDGGSVRARSSRSRWCSARCSCRRRSSAA